MDMPSFHKFEEELYNAGAGKDGLVIDVRENGGGSTADHLLTALTQPRPRHHRAARRRPGLSAGPQGLRDLEQADRRAVQPEQLQQRRDLQPRDQDAEARPSSSACRRPAASSAPAARRIMDVGILRLPFRGWFVLEDGEDMELQRRRAAHIVWPQPGDMAQGKDAQIAKAVEVLLADVKAWKERPQPKLKKATDR